MITKKNAKVTEVCGVVVHEMDIMFINYEDENVRKWCHARIEHIEGREITIRTAAGNEAFTIPKEKIIAVTEQNCFNKKIEWALYCGEIFSEEEIKISENL